MGTTLFSQRDVEARMELERLPEVVETTYIESARGRVLNPSKLTMHMGDDGGWPEMNAFAIDMPAYVGWLEVAGLKWAIATWDAETERPISSLILLFDPLQGHFKAVMEGMYLTGVRTALQSVVGLRHLPSSEPDSIGLFGAGFQAGFQLRVIDALVDVEEFRLFDIETDVARDLAATHDHEIDADIVVCDTPEAATESDALITVTDSKTPVVDEESLDDSVFLIALGSYQEVPDATILGADHLIVDHTEQCLQRGALSDLAGRGELTEDDLDATIGEILRDGEAGVIGPDEQGIFVPIGMGAVDVALADHVHERGRGDESLGQFDFGWGSP